MDCSLPGSSVHGVFQARILECVAISFSNLWDLETKGRLGLSTSQMLIGEQFLLSERRGEALIQAASVQKEP